MINWRKIIGQIHQKALLAIWRERRLWKYPNLKKALIRTPNQLLVILLLIIPLHGYAISEARIIRRAVRLTPVCSQFATKIHFTDIERDCGSKYKNAWGITNGQIIKIRKGLSAQDAYYTLIHEIGHLCEINIVKFNTWNNESNIFGKEPFVTEYAEVNDKEDFAETYAHYKLRLFNNPSPAMQRKIDFVKKVIEEYNGRVARIAEDDNAISKRLSRAHW